MLKNFVILFVFLLGFSTSNAQYLYLDDFIKLLEIAESEDRIEVEKFLESEGFSLDSFEYIIDEDDEEDDTTHYQIDYHKKWVTDQCYVRVDADSDEDTYTVVEFSYDEERTLYLASVLAEADLEPVDHWEKADGSESFQFETDDYGMIISKKINDEEEIFYTFTIYSY
jgi:hypothetical protein